MQLPLNRVLLTGAAGGLGKVLRPRLAAFAKTLRVSDLAPLGDAAPHEEVVQCELGDRAAMEALLQGCDAVVHLGGMSLDGPFAPIMNANILGVHNLYEAARIHGTKRIFFASSNHVIGFYKQSERLDGNAPLRPDGNYGVSKVFGEAMASLYWDRYGIETVSARIGSSFPKALDQRMMCTWLSYDDLTALIRCTLTAPKVEHTVVYAASANKLSWWNNDHAAHLGWTPKDSSEQFRDEIDKLAPLAADDPVAVYQGGKFTVLGPYPNPQ
jgi:uronate dehydrogenase